MKQRITLEQLLKLSPKGKKNLYKWWKLHWSDVIYDIHNPKHGIWQYISNYTAEEDRAKRDGLLPVLSIGQMIEFLMDIKELGEGFSYIDKGELYPMSGLNYSEDNWNEKEGVVLGDPRYKRTELFIDENMDCDTLWKAVKKVLEQ